MIDRLFCAALTFCLLAGGTAAIGSMLFEDAPAAAPAASVPVAHNDAGEAAVRRVQ
ncbi:hypothetical protein [Piscinibacter sp.]|uniref:hypothetical protein n=1 Tax=Piscinibacter sp. TaxID=1903157 RepID=UPI0039E5B8A2